MGASGTIPAAWEGWNSVRWHERPKAGFERFAEAGSQVLHLRNADSLIEDRHP